MDIEKYNYSFGTEYRVFKDKVLIGIVLQVGDTSYYWNKQYTRIKNSFHEFDMIYSDVFGLRFLSDEQEYGKEALKILFLQGMKANHNIESYDLEYAEITHKLFKRDQVL
ncbi:hypothetical protein [Phytobacter massiliensis]|uniref:hypothetical protein n=1 Tax=Phytobacter massiliensis TaxID=1485952 RepID=UPI0002F9B1E8|nr:hypothetical protein [Phytobacter massiliensis]